MKINILKAEDNHIEQIQALTAEWGHPATIDETEQWVEAINQSPNHAIYIAETNGDVCGWIVVEKRIFLGAGFKGEITALVVSPKYRRHGIGRELLAFAENWSREYGLSHLLVRSNIVRNKSHKFYSMTGFHLKKTAHNYEKCLTVSIQPEK